MVQDNPVGVLVVSSSRRVHGWLAAVLVLFLVLHFATHLAGLAGIETYNAAQAAMRRIYRAPLVEPLLVAAILAQMAIGARLLWALWRRGPRGGWQWAQLLSGAGILFFLAQHLPSFAVARFAFARDTTFYWPASVMQDVPLLLYFTPYYLVGVLALFVHLGCAVRLRLLKHGARLPAQVAGWGFGIAGAGIGIVIVLMLLGAFYAIDLPAEWAFAGPVPAEG